MLSAVLVGGCFDDGAGGLGGARDDDDEVGTTGATADETGTSGVAEGSSDDGGVDVSDGSSGEAQDPTGEAPSGQLRAVHAAAGVGPVDIYVAGSDAPVVQGLAYADSSPWLDLEAGDWTFEFRPAGTAPNIEPVFVSEELALADDERITAVAAGLLGSEDPSTAFRLQTIVEDWGAPLADRARAWCTPASMCLRSTSKASTPKRSHRSARPIPRASDSKPKAGIGSASCRGHNRRADELHHTTAGRGGRSPAHRLRAVRSIGASARRAFRRCRGQRGSAGDRSSGPSVVRAARLS